MIHCFKNICETYRFSVIFFIYTSEKTQAEMFMQTLLPKQNKSTFSHSLNCAPSFYFQVQLFNFNQIFLSIDFTISQDVLHSFKFSLSKNLCGKNHFFVFWKKKFVQFLNATFTKSLTVVKKTKNVELTLSARTRERKRKRKREREKRYREILETQKWERKRKKTLRSKIKWETTKAFCERKEIIC